MRYITPKRVTSSRDYFRVIAPAQHSFFQRNVTVLATLRPIWPTRSLNLRTTSMSAFPKRPDQFSSLSLAAAMQNSDLLC